MDPGEILSLNIKDGLKEESEQIQSYWSLEKTFLNVLHGSGFPDLAFNKKVDFEELYKKNQETKN